MTFNQLNELMFCLTFERLSGRENLFIDESFGADWSNIWRLINVGNTFAISFVLEYSCDLEITFQSDVELFNVDDCVHGEELVVCRSSVCSRSHEKLLQLHRET